MILVTKACDIPDVYYAMCSDVLNDFTHRRSGTHYVQLAIASDPDQHPDLIVKDLAKQIVDNYDITKDINYEC